MGVYKRAKGMSDGTLQREQIVATLGKVVPWGDLKMSRVLRYDGGKLVVVQEVDGKDKSTGREWHSMKANYGRLEKKWKMDLKDASSLEWPTAGYKFIASAEGLTVERFENTMW